MTPKEKAKELVEKYLKKIIELAYAETKTKELAKESALICVEQMIEACEGYIKGIKYWQDVKQEINKL